ncbi:DUF2157 domain-containing protein [Parendozoicomonas sp. Alg238-R29]|uniref:DUF2157 domain-containing protein n=1 Tax=Parendozoicomonas sp. Alg238-R29 TaxID=2993446 RepID=UPI00248DB8B3|nr:DUF2157 domain-containing protein [Parendozoicomonas sp. Alg238-R29]
MVAKGTLQKAVEQNLLQPEQVEPLYSFLKQQSGPRFDLTHVLYYFGGLIAIGALTLFMTLGWEEFGGAGILIISCVYAMLGLFITTTFQQAGRDIPAGICAAFVIAITPLAVYGFQQTMGWWPDDSVYQEFHRHIKFLWIYMELATLLVGAIMIWRYRYPFMLMPVAVTLLYLSMDIAELFLGEDYGWRERGWITMWFGLAMTLFAFLVDIRSRKTLDYSFWLYLFGVMAFWGGMSSQHSDSEFSKFIYLCINLLLAVSGVVIARRVFVVFGALGVAGYLGHLANEVFENSWLFPIALTVIGLAIIWLGVVWQKNEAKISLHLRQKVPGVVRELLDKRNV